MNVRGVDPRRDAVEHRMEPAKRTTVPEIIQHVDHELAIALCASPTVQSVQPQVLANIAVQCFRPPFVQDRINDARPGFVGAFQQAKDLAERRRTTPGVAGRKSTQSFRARSPAAS